METGMTHNSDTTNVIKVSVIVPVYNVEPYLKQCMDTICNQTLQEIEVICVDDGSTDSSLSILREYKEKDDRIQLYQQPHQYAGAARNLGMSYATGEYLVFWDSDDYFAVDALEKLYDRASSLQADICVCGGNQYYESSGKTEVANKECLNAKRIPDIPTFNRVSNEEHIIDFTRVVVWNKIFRSTFIAREGLHFPAVRNGEDAFFTVNALCRAERITTLNEPLVTYRKARKGSLSDTVSENPTVVFEVWYQMALGLQQKQIFPEKSFSNMALSAILYALQNINNYETFVEAITYLQSGVLEEMGIIPGREEGYYNARWHCELVDHLTKDSAETFLMYLSYHNYKGLQKTTIENRATSQDLKRAKKTVEKEKNELDLQKKIVEDYRKENEKYRNQEKKTEKCYREKEKYQKELTDIKGSISFRIGRGITWLPRKARDLLRRM